MILTSLSALVKNGLIYPVNDVLYLSTWRSTLDNVPSIGKLFICNNNYSDTEYLVEGSDGILIPTPERAIVEYILNEKHRDEGILIEALISYSESECADYPLLYKVAEHFNLPKEMLDFWIEEAREETYV